MLTQKIEYTDIEIVLPPPVKKQVWDSETQSFMPMTLYKRTRILSNAEIDWMRKTYGLEGSYKNGRYWDYSRAGNFIVMDEKVFMWFEMKWSNK